MIAGPSEILIICDGKTNPDWIAMDLFSQAEHDEDAQAILISDDVAYLAAVEASINRLLPTMERAEIIRTSLTNRGALILVENLNQAAEVANIIAPEHLELSIENPEILCEKFGTRVQFLWGDIPPKHWEIIALDQIMFCLHQALLVFRHR